MKITFSFGKNWLRYVRYILDENIIQNAMSSLTKFIPQSQFKDKIFLDIGSGSGLFSLCALRLGAQKVISIDIDKSSVLATNLCKNKFAPDATNWEIFQGSILDSAFIQELKDQIQNKQTILYSWGVLHHTGDLTQAMQNCVNLQSMGGGFLKARTA